MESHWNMSSAGANFNESEIVRFLNVATSSAHIILFHHFTQEWGFIGVQVGPTIAVATLVHYCRSYYCGSLNSSQSFQLRSCFPILERINWTEDGDACRIKDG